MKQNIFSGDKSKFGVVSDWWSTPLHSLDCAGKGFQSCETPTGKGKHFFPRFF